MRAIFRYVKGYELEKRASMFSAAPEDKTQSKRFQFFLMVKAVSQWNGPPQKVTSLEVSEQMLDGHLL